MLCSAALVASYSDTSALAYLSGHSLAQSLSAGCFIVLGSFVVSARHSLVAPLAFTRLAQLLARSRPQDFKLQQKHAEEDDEAD